MTSGPEREERFKAVVNEICRLFDESRRDPGAVLRVDLPLWKICGALGVKGDSPDWCYTFPPEMIARESPASLARKWFADYQTAYKSEEQERGGKR